LSDFNKALEINPESYLAFNNRGYFYLLVGDVQNAELDFNTSIELNPNYAKTWYNRGTLHLNSNPELAIPDLEQATALDPNYLDAFNNLGSVYYQLSQFDKSIEAYTNAVTISPNTGSIWLNLSIVKNSAGFFKEALNDTLQAKNKGAQVPESYLATLQSKAK
jgi:Tfp pilus assembly protein PilF